MLRARQGQRILQQLALGPLGSITIGQHVHVYIAVSQRGRLLNRLGDTAQRVLTDHDAIDHDLKPSARRSSNSLVYSPFRPRTTGASTNARRPSPAAKTLSATWSVV